MRGRRKQLSDTLPDMEEGALASDLNDMRTADAADNLITEKEEDPVNLDQFQQRRAKRNRKTMLDTIEKLKREGKVPGEPH